MRQHSPVKVAAIAAVVVLFSWAVLLNLWVKSDRSPVAMVPEVTKASAATSTDSLAEAIRNEGQVERLTIQTIEGIVIIRGKTRDQAVVDRINKLAKEQGFGRVANLIQITAQTDDEKIVREAERQLGQSPALDGCRFNIASSDGIITISGTVQRELQKDLVRQLARRVEGVKEVRTDLRQEPLRGVQVASGRG